MVKPIATFLSMILTGAALCLSVNALADAGGAGGADPAAGLPSDFAPVSIEASRRALQAKMQDWSDDRQEIHSQRILHCAIAGVEGALVGSSMGEMPTLVLLADLPRYLGSSAGSVEGGPLSAPLAAIAKRLAMTPAEQSNLQRLMNVKIEDLADRIRLYIDAEAFLMRVSARLYQEQIDLHQSRIGGFLGIFQADLELCTAYTLQDERDVVLLQASDRVLAFYNFLEQELAD